MIELQNRQYATELDCVAGEQLRVGQLVRLTATNGELVASAPTAITDFDVTGPMVATWINPRSTTTTYSGDADGLGFTATPASDPDAQTFIPSGARMRAVAGIGATQIRFHKSALPAEFQVTLPVLGQVLGVDDDGFLCSAGNAITGMTKVARVVYADSASVGVILGIPA
jgi:hypothetical protein